MADGPPSTNARPINRLVPALQLVSVLPLAFDIRKLGLAAIGMLVLQSGWWLLDSLFQTGNSLAGPFGVADTQLLFTFHPATDLTSIFSDVILNFSVVILNVIEPYVVLARPFLSIIGFGHSGQTSSWVMAVHALCCMIWAIAFWSLVGGTICRMTAIRITQARQPSLAESFRFTKQRAFDFVVAPLCPLLGIAVCALAGLPFGLLYWIPIVGPILAGLLFVVMLVLSLIITLLATGLLVGWPLFPAAVATGADDALDALSRCFSYLNQRVGLFVLMLIIASIVATLGLVLAGALAEIVIAVTRWNASITAPGSVTAVFFGQNEGFDGLAAQLHAFWIHGVRLLAHGWIYSFFWSAATMIYLILRQDVDGATWDQIDPPAATLDNPNANLPLAKPSEPLVTAAP